MEVISAISQTQKRSADTRILFKRKKTCGFQKYVREEVRKFCLCRTCGPTSERINSAWLALARDSKQPKGINTDRINLFKAEPANQIRTKS